MNAIGPVAVRPARIRDRIGPERIRFASAILAFADLRFWAWNMRPWAVFLAQGPQLCRPQPKIGTLLRPIPSKGRNLMRLVSI
jgi:hypothetical protein